MSEKTALITGSAKRVGAVIARYLHKAGMRVVIHYHHSKEAAQQLCEELNAIRADSAASVGADLNDIGRLPALIEKAAGFFGGLDVLVNNASSFYPTPVEEASSEDWQNLFATNAQAPFFLSQAAAPYLKKQSGSIVNMLDIHADRPLKQHTLYCMAKAANAMMTKSLAKELAPDIRVNGVAPGMILWPDDAVPDNVQQSVVKRIPLKRVGSPENIAETILFLLNNDYITGQVIAVDGGRLLHI